MSRQKIPEIILAATERGVHRLVRFAHSCCFGVTSLLALFLEPFVHYTVIFQKKAMMPFAFCVASIYYREAKIQCRTRRQNLNSIVVLN